LRRRGSSVSELLSANIVIHATWFVADGVEFGAESFLKGRMRPERPGPAGVARAPPLDLAVDAVVAGFRAGRLMGAGRRQVRGPTAPLSGHRWRPEAAERPPPGPCSVAATACSDRGAAAGSTGDGSCSGRQRAAPQLPRDIPSSQPARALVPCHIEGR